MPRIEYSVPLPKSARHLAAPERATGSGAVKVSTHGIWVRCEACGRECFGADTLEQHRRQSH